MNLPTPSSPLFFQNLLLSMIPLPLTIVSSTPYLNTHMFLWKNST